MRNETRLQRYDAKRSTARTMPVSITTLNFLNEANLAFVVRAAACFGASCVNVIGSVPERKLLKPLSGSTCDLVPIKQYSHVLDYLDASQDSDIICLELTDYSKPLSEFNFNFCDRPIHLVVGHEEIGIPASILNRSSHVLYIDMPGRGFCLNTSQAANIALYEASKQFFSR